MTTLDRYIARQFLVNVVVLLTILFLFVIAIDVAINLGRFAEAGASLSASDDPGVLGRAWLTAYAVCDLWWPRLVQLYGFLLGLVMVAALGFTATQLARSRELLAMVAAGQSLHRVARPVLIVAGGLTLLQAGAQELVLPRVAPLLSRDHGDAGKRFGSAAPIPLVATDDGVLLSAAAFDAELGVLERPFFFEVDERGRSTQVVRAERATWSEPDGAWVLENGYAESRLAAGTAGDRPAPVAKNRVQTSLDPARLRFERDAAYRQALGFAQARSMLENAGGIGEQTKDGLRRIMWGRVSVMACNILSLLIAMPFFVTRQPDGIMPRVLRGTPLALTALMGGILGSSAAIPGLENGWLATLGVFLPVLVLAPLAAAALGAIKT